MKKLKWGLTAVFCLFAAFLVIACGPVPVEKKAPAAVSQTPVPPEPVQIEKPVNVSFSTYSKDWPVGWQWIDPDEKYNPTPHDVKNGVLRVRVPTAKELLGDSLTAPRYVKRIKGDFQIETHVRFLPKENFQGAGLLIFKDERNYLRFQRVYGGQGGGAEGIRMDVWKGDEYIPIVTPNEIQTEIPELDLKIVRKGTTFTCFWRADDNSEWLEAGKFESDFPDTVFAGVIACNTAREVIAEFAYIRLLPVSG